MSGKLAKEIRVELEQIGLLMERHPSLLEKCHVDVPTEVEIDALGALLHAFYTGVENVFKRVAATFDEGPLTSQFWHVELLDGMTLPTESRPAVISAELRGTLREYLQFRHVFRHAYLFRLEWSKMSSLVRGIRDVARQFSDELEAFIQAIM